MNFNFELILFYATLITGVIALIDLLVFAPRRAANDKPGLILDYSRSFFPVLLLVFLLRSFLYEPFRIPSCSLEPTLLMGDFILVNKYQYGVRLPVIHTKIFGTGTPQRGDIMVFRWPPNPSVNFIKRVIGLPGDKISYINKELYINGVKMPQEFLTMSNARSESGLEWQAEEKVENLPSLKHHIYVDPTVSTRDFQDIEVPPGMYFVLGDNRDKSADSRFWGFVPDENIVGKASLVWMSWNGAKTNIRFNRIGNIIH